MKITIFMASCIITLLSARSGFCSERSLDDASISPASRSHPNELGIGSMAKEDEIDDFEAPKSIEDIICLAMWYEESGGEDDEEQDPIKTARKLFEEALEKAQQPGSGVRKGEIDIINSHLNAIILNEAHKDGINDKKIIFESAKKVIDAATRWTNHPILQRSFDIHKKTFADYVGRTPNKNPDVKQATLILLQDLFPNVRKEEWVNFWNLNEIGHG